MSKYRHSFSFIISSIIFSLVGFSFFLLAQRVETSKRKLPPPVIKIAIITPPKPIIKKVIEKKKVTPVIVPPVPLVHKIKKKVKTKKIIKKKIKKRRKIKKRKIIKKKRVLKRRVIKKKPLVKKKKIIRKHKALPKKRVIKKHIVKKRIIRKKVIKKREPIIEPFVEPIIQPEPIIRTIEEERYIPPPPRPHRRPKRVIEPVIKEPIPIERTIVYEQPIKADKSAEKQRFLSQVRSKIIANKRYPKMALRRHIQGSVKVKFDITSSGEVANIQYLNGKTILQKGAKKAIEKSFPITVPSYLKSELPINSIYLTIHFNIN